MEKHASQLESGRIEEAADRLDSWKEIAAYLYRDVTTAQRWERREAMPIHRHLHGRLGSVYAFRSELDAWRRNRRPAAHSDSEGTNLTSDPRSHIEHSVSRAQDVLGRSEPRIDGVRKLQLRHPVTARRVRRWVSGFAVLVSVFAAGFITHAIWVNVTDPSRTSLGGIPSVEDQGATGHPISVSPAAYHEYRVGRYYLWRYDEENLKLAIRHFERAIRIDPTYAPAFAALSNAWWARGMFGPMGLRAAESPVRRAAQTALALDDRLAATYVAQADVKRLFDKDPRTAEQLLKRALALDPNSVEAHHSLALLLMALGRFPEALAHIQRAATLDPLAPAVQSNFGRILYRAGRFEAAVSRLERALELEPGMRSVYARLGDVYDQLGQYDRALEAYDRWGKRGPAREARVARVLARMGRSDEAKLLLQSLADDQSELPLPAAAAAYSALGDTNEAARLLAAAIERDNPGLPYFPVDPQFVSLHTVPQWPELVHRAGLSIARRY
jgi:tetratricopeptide (TPR) repeat protein